MVRKTETLPLRNKLTEADLPVDLVEYISSNFVYGWLALEQGVPFEGIHYQTSPDMSELILTPIT